MKIRAGFVSNSSSSSFIVGIGKIDDINLFEQLKEKYPKGYEKPWLCTGLELAESKNKWAHVSISADRKKVSITGGGNSDPDVTIDFDEFGKYIVYNINNDEGDGAFYEVDEDGEYGDLDYDIDLSWFSEEQQEIFELIEGLDVNAIIYGAERNG